MNDNISKDVYDKLANLIRSKYGIKNVEITTVDVDLFKLINNLDNSTAICKLYKEGEVLVCVTKRGLIVEDLLDYYNENE